jgi:hypothetical protein
VRPLFPPVLFEGFADFGQKVKEFRVCVKNTLLIPLLFIVPKSREIDWQAEGLVLLSFSFSGGWISLALERLTP